MTLYERKRIYTRNTLKKYHNDGSSINKVFVSDNNELLLEFVYYNCCVLCVYTFRTINQKEYGSDRRKYFTCIKKGNSFIIIVIIAKIIDLYNFIH